MLHAASIQLGLQQVFPYNSEDLLQFVQSNSNGFVAGFYSRCYMLLQSDSDYSRFFHSILETCFNSNGFLAGCYSRCYMLLQSNSDCSRFFRSILKTCFNSNEFVASFLQSMLHAASIQHEVQQFFFFFQFNSGGLLQVQWICSRLLQLMLHAASIQL